MQWCVTRLGVLVPLCLSIFSAAVASDETDGLSTAAAVDRLEVAHRVEYFLNTPEFIQRIQVWQNARGFSK